MSYDIIGDIHGYARPLEQLLAKMDYQKINGAWKHPERTVIFIGDYIDRGKQQLETVNIVRRMVDAGSAQAIMGNHELNALAWFHKDENGDYLRKHEGHNVAQHQEFLEQVGENSAKHQEILDWFLTLPLWLDLPEIRAVHACWDQPSIDYLKNKLNGGNRITLEQLESATKKPSLGEPGLMFNAIETILKGIEVKLPEGITFEDSGKKERNDIRVKWWGNRHTTYRKTAILGETELQKIPDTPISIEINEYTDKPVFIGHYWLNGTPEILKHNIACVDYSVALKGKLTAYRWNGEEVLNNAHFHQHE
jgi:hypothetical protein